MIAPSFEENYYQVLGVEPDARPEEVKRAFRREALRTHPDLHGPDADAAAFRRVKRAYEVLSNPAERARYDVLTGVRPGGSESGLFYRRSFDRLFANLFNGLRAAMNARVDLM